MISFSLRRSGYWIIPRIWHLTILALLIGNTIIVFKAYKKLRKEATAIHAENQKIQTDINALQTDIKFLQTRFDALSDIPLALAETPTGVKYVHASQGVSRTEIDFLSRYRGAILGEKTNVETFQPRQLIESLKSALVEGFNKDNLNLQLRTGSEREALIAYAVLRTNGSMPTYEVRDTIPNNLKQLVQGTSGNCSDFTIRLMMMLESIGVKATTISSHTKNLGGHVFVDAYDPIDDKAYLLDANFNVMIVLPTSEGRGFLETLLTMKPGERKEYAHSADISVFPVYFRFLDPGKNGLTRTPLTPEYINEHRADREPMWRRWLAEDGGELIDWWIRTPNHVPKTLKEFSKFLSAIPNEFDVSTDYASRLRKAAALKNVPL